MSDPLRILGIPAGFAAALAAPADPSPSAELFELLLNLTDAAAGVLAPTDPASALQTFRTSLARCRAPPREGKISHVDFLSGAETLARALAGGAPSPTFVLSWSPAMNTLASAFADGQAHAAAQRAPPTGSTDVARTTTTSPAAARAPLQATTSPITTPPDHPPTAAQSVDQTVDTPVAPVEPRDEPAALPPTSATATAPPLRGIRVNLYDDASLADIELQRARSAAGLSETLPHTQYLHEHGRSLQGQPIWHLPAHPDACAAVADRWQHERLDHVATTAPLAFIDEQVASERRSRLALLSLAKPPERELQHLLPLRNAAAVSPPAAREALRANAEHSAALRRLWFLHHAAQETLYLAERAPDRTTQNDHQLIASRLATALGHELTHQLRQLSFEAYVLTHEDPRDRVIATAPTASMLHDDAFITARRLTTDLRPWIPQSKTNQRRQRPPYRRNNNHHSSLSATSSTSTRSSPSRNNQNHYKNNSKNNNNKTHNHNSNSYRKNDNSSSRAASRSRPE